MGEVAARRKRTGSSKPRRGESLPFKSVSVAELQCCYADKVRARFEKLFYLLTSKLNELKLKMVAFLCCRCKCVKRTRRI